MSIGIALTVASTLFSTISAISQSRNEAAMFRYRQQIAQRNAEVARQAAEREIELGDIEKQDVERKSRLVRAQQEAALAGAGVQVGVGSALDLTIGTAALFEEDALMVLANARQRAFERKEQAIGFEQEAVLRGRAGQTAQTSGLFTAAGTLLTGASKVAAKWSDAFNPTPKKQSGPRG